MSRRASFHHIAPDDLYGALEIRTRELLGPLTERSRGRVSLSELIDQVRKRESQLWGIWQDDRMESVTVTRIVVYESSGRRVFRIDFAGGRLEDAVAFMPTLELLAREAKCSAMRIEGRVGWHKIFPDWEEVSRIIEKEL